MNSIDIKTKRGKYAYMLLTQFQTPAHPGGLFRQAWNKLVIFHEKKDKGEEINYENKYFEYTFTKKFYPPAGITRLDEKRMSMNRNISQNRQVDDDEFIQHVLAKLPKGGEGIVGPYQAQRTLINKTIAERHSAKPKQEYTVDDLTIDLLEVYNNLYPEDASLDNSASSDDEDNKKRKSNRKGETALAAFGRQPKHKCGKCGKWGHLT
jgi:hypothetical protein